MFIAVVICGGARCARVLPPTPNFGDSTIMLSKIKRHRLRPDWRPFASLAQPASARLIAGKSDPPSKWTDKFLNTVPLGSGVGIVGAPTSINGATTLRCRHGRYATHTTTFRR